MPESAVEDKEQREQGDADTEPSNAKPNSRYSMRKISDTARNRSRSHREAGSCSGKTRSCFPLSCLEVALARPQPG